MTDGTSVPTATLKSAGAVWLAAWRLTSFQIDCCCSSVRVSVSLAPVVLFDMWPRAEAAVAPVRTSAAASASEADFFIVRTPRENHRPCRQNGQELRMFH